MQSMEAMNTYEDPKDIEDEDSDVHASDSARDVFGGMTNLCSSHTEDLRAELEGVRSEQRDIQGDTDTRTKA
jgi:hypothetical protein